jgi:hypothetical protein
VHPLFGRSERRTASVADMARPCDGPRCGPEPGSGEAVAVTHLMSPVLAFALLLALATAWVARRWLGAAARYARSAAISSTYLLVLVITTGVLESSGRRVAERLLLEHSTNLHHLARDPIRVLVASAFWLSSAWQLAPAAAALALLVAPLERRVGGRRTAAVLAIGHVGATLLVAGGLWLAVRAGAVTDAVVDARDVGPSYALFAAVASLVFLLERRLRGAFLATLVGYGAARMAVTPTFTAAGHLVSIGIGLACYPLVAGRSAGLAAVGAPLVGVLRRQRPGLSRCRRRSRPPAARCRRPHRRRARRASRARSGLLRARRAARGERSGAA